MTTRARLLWTRLVGTLWFIPSLIALGMSILAIAMIDVSSHVDERVLARFPRVFGADAESSRSLLSSIAGSMITVAGLTFSLTMIAVTQASSQYTPRILRNFIRDRGNQVVLGVYVGIFAYCLLVVRTIRSGANGYVPSVAVVVGLALAIASVGVLLYFVHHIANNLQASTIVDRIMRDTISALDRAFPRHVGEPATGAEREDVDEELADAQWTVVVAPETGYVQTLDGESLMATAEQHDVVVRLVPDVGDFVIHGLPIAHVATRRGTLSANEKPHASDGRNPHESRTPLDGVRDHARMNATDDELASAITRAFMISDYRMVDQDAAFGIRQLVDIALKALSAGINDSTTALTCIDHLGAILVSLVDREIASRMRAEDGAVRVIAAGPTFEKLVGLAIDEIRQNTHGDVSVLSRMFTMLRTVASRLPPGERRQLIHMHVRLLDEAANVVTSTHDRTRLRAMAESASMQ